MTQPSHRAPPVLVILGPTASGKSLMAMNVARRAHGEILSVDALKLYKRLDIGTAKPTPAERAEIKHHGLDLIEPNETFSVAEFFAYADPLLADILSRKRLPILDVTAPLYLKALMYGLQQGPRPDALKRRELEARHNEDLYAELKRLDPARAQELHPNDRKRIIRALEHAHAGQPMSAKQETWGQPRQDYRWVLTGIRWPREALYERVQRRIDAMLAQGWLDEVKGVQSTTGFSKTAGEAHGYKRLLAHLRGELTLEEAIEQTRRDVKLFARKSLTFFKSFPKVQWLDVNSEEEIVRAALYLTYELKEMLNEAGISRNLIELP